MKAFKLTLLIIWALALAIFAVQNRASLVSLVILGQAGLQLSLSAAIFLAYGVGIGLGLLLLGSWWLHDLLLQRQAIRYLTRLSDRITLLESQPNRTEYLPPVKDYSIPADRVASETSDWRSDRWDS
jgi:uncharacterized membrane protein YciS (DUF1049 family)